MKVQNKLMYHISRKVDWKVGDIIESGHMENQFWLTCKNISINVKVNEQEMPIFSMFDLYSTFDLTQNNIDFLYTQLKTVSNETALYIREQIFEDYRCDNHPELPSRQKCLWVTDLDQLEYWKTAVRDQNRCLLTLELEGDIFRCDAYWLTVNTFSSNVYEERAKHYWAGEESINPEIEYLFYGKARIKEIQMLT